MQVQKVSNLIDVMRTGGEFITVHRVEFQLLVLAGLAVVLWHLVRKRRSKTLSILVERKFGEYKGKLHRRPSLSERLSSLKYVITAFVFPIVISLVFGFLGLVVGDGENDPQDIVRFLSTLHACGTIVASFTAIVITVTTFAITVNSSYIGKTSSLIRFFLENLGFKPLAAFAVGTIVATIANSTLVNYFGRWDVVYILWPLVIMGGLVVCADLVFLLRATMLIGQSSVSGFLIGAYKNVHRDSLLAHVKRTLAQTMFVESLQKLGFLWNPYDLYEGTERAEYSVKSGGRFVNDVYFDPLKKLAKKWSLRPIEKDERQRWNMYRDNPPNIRIWPGQKLSEKEDCYPALLVKDKAWENWAQQIFAKAFNCGKKERWDIPQVEWSEISHLLKTLIEDKDIDGVKSVLEAFRSIAADYLESRLQLEWPHTGQTLDEEIMSPYRAPTLRNLDFYNFIRFAIKNEDEECLDEVARFLYGMAYKAFEFESVEYFDEVLVRLNWLYELSRGSERLAERGVANVIRHYENVGKIFDYHVYNDKDNPDLYKHVFPFIERYLKNILNAMRQATKHCDSNTFEKLLKITNSLLEHYIPDDVRQQYSYNYRQQDPALLEAKLKIRDTQILSNLVIAAWLYRGVEVKEYKREDVRLLINASLEKILDFRTLIEIYLYADGLESHGSNLGYDWWELSEKEPGEGLDGSAFGNWIQPFWITIALRRAASKPKIDMRSVRLLQHVSDFNCQSLFSQIDSILMSRDHKWLTGKENLRKGKEYLLGVFGALAQRQRKIDYEKIITDRINERAIDAFKKRVIEAYESKTKLRNLLTEYQCSRQENDGTITKALEQFQGYIDKKDLTGDGRDIGLARIYGEHVGQRETLYYAGIMEKMLIEKGIIENFGELAARIKNEAARLRKKGFNPQVVLIPQDHRYERVLTDVPKWKRQCPIERSPLPRWVTSIDGMEVFVWPHKDSECVGVIDIGAFARFKDNEDGPQGPLNICFRNLTRDELNKFLVNEAKKERKEFKRWMRVFEYNLDKVSEMKRVVVVEDKGRLEILDCGAGAKFLPTEKTMGIVYKQDETVYHLPECKLTQEIPPSERRYFCNLGIAELEREFQPCGNCHPNREK